MSHFSVAVFTDEQSPDVSELLAPYDENIIVPRYVAHTKVELIEIGREDIERYRAGVYAQYKKDPDGYKNKYGKNTSHMNYIENEFPKRLLWTDEEVYKEQIKYYDVEDIGHDGEVYSTYNPKSKWDWYSIGNRWNGMLILKSDVYKTKYKYEDTKDNNFNEALVQDIDFDTMRRNELRELTPYKEYMSGKHLYNSDYLKKLYPNEEIYIQANTEFSTYAVITPDGEWHAPGEMGWFGCSSESPEDSRKFHNEYFERFIKPGIENGWTMTIVDCHI